MADLNKFSLNMRGYALAVEKNADKAVKKVALAVDREVIISTPVDTGQARANWVVSVGARITESTKNFLPGERGNTGPENARIAIEEGKGRILARKSPLAIFIQNNVDYIEKLNNGSSAQAPAGFVQKSLAAGIKSVKSVKLLTGQGL